MARSAQATGRLTNRKRTRGRRRFNFRSANLEEIEARLQALRDRQSREAGKPTRRVYRNMVENRDRLYQALVRRAHATGSLTFNTTITQLARADGYPVSGDRRADEQRFGQNVRRALVDLQGAGLVQWSGVKWPNGQWRCIEVCIIDTANDSPSAGAGVHITIIIVRRVRAWARPTKRLRVLALGCAQEFSISSSALV